MMKHFAALLAISLILLPIAGCSSAGDPLNSPDTSAAIPEDTAAVPPADMRRAGKRGNRPLRFLKSR